MGQNFIHLPTAQQLWRRHVVLVLRVLLRALEQLHSSEQLPAPEEALDRQLFLSARNTYFALDPFDRPQGFHLMGKAELPPTTTSDLAEAWPRMKPDFTWRMHDDSATSAETMTKDFHIESKRLGTPTSRTWILTEQYVLAGIMRFLSPDHRYGNNVSDGAMIGYVQNWDVAGILAEVNQHASQVREHNIPPLDFNDHGTPVIDARQSLVRQSVAPANFVLHHLWVDLRRDSTAIGV